MRWLRVSWAARLAAAQALVRASDADFSWRAQLEARVLRFLVSRYQTAFSQEKKAKRAARGVS